MDVPLRESGVFVFGPFRLNPVRRTLLHNGNPVTLTSRLFDTLLYLVQNPDRLVERCELEQAVWRGRIVEDGNLQKAVSGLRKVLQENDPGGTYIVTLQGRGLRFAVPVVCAWEAPEGAPLVGPSVDTTPEAHAGRRRAWLIPAALLVMAVIFVLCGVLWRWQHQLGTAAAFAPPPHSVAVLAFENLSGDPNQAYFSDGLSEELINSLGRTNALHVAARVSAFSFKGTSATIGEIARKLNVGAVLEGSVRREGGSLRITAQLIDAGSGFQLWSNEYDRDQGELLTIQRDIAEAVAASLKVALAGDDVANLTRGGSVNAGAYDSYLHGSELIRRLDRSAFPEALLAFDKALAADPAFALAYTGRAIALLDIAYDKGDAEAESRQRMLALARAASDRTIALEPRLAEGYAARALILDFGLLDTVGAVADAVSAAALAPNDLQAQFTLAEVLMDAGRVREAVAAAQRGTELDPYSPNSWEILGYVLYKAHRFDSALAALNHVAALAGHLPPMAASVFAYTELMRGDANAAARTCPGIGTGPRRAMCLAIADNALGRIDDARTQFDAMRAAPSYTQYDGAVIYAQWGMAAEALDALEAAYGARDPKLGQIGADPLLDPLRSLRKFQDIARRVAQGPRAAEN